MIPLVTAVIGILGGYYFSNRSQLKFKRIEDESQLKSKLIEDLDQKIDVYLKLIANLDIMLNNREFLMLVEDPKKIYATLKKIGDESNNIKRSEFNEYLSVKDGFRQLTEKNPMQHKEFGDKVQHFRNSLVIRYNILIDEYSLLTNYKKYDAIEEFKRKLTVNDKHKFGDTHLVWLD